MVITKKCDNCSWQQNGRYCGGGGGGGGGVCVCVCVCLLFLPRVTNNLATFYPLSQMDGEEIIHCRSTNILKSLERMNGPFSI